MGIFSKNKDSKFQGTFNSTDIEIISDVSSNILSTLSLDDLLKNSIDKVVKRFGFLGGLLFLVEENYLYAKTISGGTTADQFIKLIGRPISDLKIELDEKLNNYVVNAVLTGKNQFSYELSDFTRVVLSDRVSEVAKTLTRTRACLAIPIFYNEKTIGALFFSKSEKRDFEIEMPMLNLVGNQIGIAIVNARLFKDSQNQITLLTAKNKELQSLYALTSNVSKSLDPQTVAQLSVDSLPQDDIMVGGALSRYDEEHGKIFVVTSTRNQLSYQVEKVIGNFSQYVLDLHDERPEVQNNISNIAVKSGQPTFSDNLSDYMEPAVPKQFVGMIGSILNIKSVAVYPVTSKGRIVGTIAFFLKGKKASELDDNNKQLLATYANQIGIAYENANLYKLSQETQQNLEIALSQLEDVRRHERDMIDIMGHELRTPISIVRNALVMMDMQVKKDPNQPTTNVTKLLDMAVDSTRREVDLIETLLSATKTEGKGFQLVLEKINLLEIVQETLNAFQRDAEKKGLQVIYTPPAEPIYIYADRTRTQEAADNFMSNALKYTFKGSIQITVSSDKVDGFFAIKDSGIGITEDDLKRLGEKFFRARQYIDDQIAANDELKSKIEVVRPGGTGLGLFVTFNLIKIMDGKINVDSKVGEGSTFAFGLPLYAGQAIQQVERKTEHD